MHLVFFIRPGYSSIAKCIQRNSLEVILSAMEQHCSSIHFICITNDTLSTSTWKGLENDAFDL